MTIITPFMMTITPINCHHDGSEKGEVKLRFWTQVRGKRERERERNSEKKARASVYV
jgi:hypothetical protein